MRNGLVSYARTVKTTSRDHGAGRVVLAARVEHLGSAHSEAECETLTAVAQQRMAAGQLELGLGLGGGWTARALPAPFQRAPERSSAGASMGVICADRDAASPWRHLSGPQRTCTRMQVHTRPGRRGTMGG
jgi:hypothetical protein